MSYYAPVELRLRQWRQRRGLSLRALGTRAGVSYVTVAEVEAGRQSPTVNWLQKIAAALDISVRDLFPVERRRRGARRRGR
jgi:transcriptional regulator with XRE-family HTH domain